MARFTFEVCQQDQVRELVEYIDTHWARNHILVTSRKLLDWQHKSKQGDYYNFIMARHNKSGQICGVLGFIPTSHFSAELEPEKEVWLAIWKVNEGPKYIGLGLGLLNFLKREFSIKNICSIGISQIVFPMYQALGFEVGKMSQMVLVNALLKTYSIAKLPRSFCYPSLVSTCGFTVADITEPHLSVELANANLFQNKTQKDYVYFVERFVKHPKFDYQFIGVYEQNKLKTFMVVRVVNYKQSSAMRVVDIQGELSAISKVSSNLHDLIADKGHEYLDIMQYGMDENELLNAGFIKVGAADDIVIPDYFQPFVQKNISIFFARQSLEHEASFTLFKGDADQDRPNIM